MTRRTVVAPLLAALSLLPLAPGASLAQRAPSMTMTTPIPPGITTPDNLETRLGDLNFFDGVPDQASTDKVYDFIDFQRAYQAYMNGIQVASMDAIRKGILEFGPANTTVVLFEDLMDSKALFLTANTTSVYMFSWLQLGNEPMVIETPPDVLGIIDDHWFRYVGDFGRLGPDKGKGGKFLVLPPGYKGAVPEGYHVLRTNTYGNWVIWRGFQVDGSTAPAVQATRANFRMYPLSRKDNPPPMRFFNASDKPVNTIHRMDAGIFEEINEVVQAEPSFGENPEILGSFAAIGIRKSQPFKPDARWRGILDAAARAGAVTVKTVISKPRDDMFYFYPGKSVWMNPFPGGEYSWVKDGATLLDARAAFHFYATGITPAMAKKIIGRGSKYAYTYLDQRPPAPRWQQELQSECAARCARQGFLVVHPLRQPDPLHAPDRPALPRHRRQEGRPDPQCRRLGGCLLRAGSPRRQGEQLGADDSRPGLEHDLPPLRPPGALVRQDLEAGRTRTGLRPVINPGSSSGPSAARSDRS